MDEFSVKVNGQEVKSPVLKIFVVIMTLVVVMTPIVILATLVILNAWATALVWGLLTIVAVALVITHFILRAIGRHGFIVKNHPTAGETFIRIGICRESFKKI